MTNQSSCQNDPPETVKTALCVIGDKWTALIIRTLHERPKRFTDFRDELSDLNPRTLTQRLAMLVDEEIISKEHFEDPSPSTRYVLTQKGKDLDQVIHSMAQWGDKYSKTSQKAS